MQMCSLKHASVVLAFCIGAVFGTECSTQDRTSNLAGCLTKIKDTMKSTSKFWFGTDYAVDCPNGFLDGIECTNVYPAGLSIATRMLPGGWDESLLTKFINVKYTSNPGQYTGCGNTFTDNQMRIFDVDPASSDIVRPWHVRKTPEMTWDAVAGEYYAIYVYDVGNLITHAVYINIQGNSIPSSGPNAVDPYHGPLRSTSNSSPYIFLLFKQQGYLDPQVASEWYNASHATATTGFAATSHIPGFMSLLNMTGPIAANWIVVTGDEYAAGVMYSRGILVTCPVFIGKALDMKPRPFLPNQSALNILMEVSFDVEELNYSTCCRNYTESQRTYPLNPIGNELLSTATARSNMRQTVTLEKQGLFAMRTMFTGEMFTMIALDPDVPISSVGTESRPLIHQMQINIMNGNFTSGEEVVAWNGPYPPNDVPHYYYFLLYKHVVPVDRTKMLSYAGNCGTRLAGRCLYDINKAVSENGLTLVGANWFRSVKDPYVIYRNIQSNPNSEATECAGQDGYTSGCTGQNACSPENRVNDLPNCLLNIKATMYSTDKFWFGTDYAVNCPNGYLDGFLCTNVYPSGLSIATRIMPSGYDDAVLTKFLTVKFTSDPGQYTGCGNTVIDTETRMFDVDPSSPDIVRPWHVRQTPEMTWDAVVGEYYAIYVYDVANLITHAVYINIQGNNIPTSGPNAIDPYHGPLRSTSANSPYIFMLFKQQGYLNPKIAMEWYNASHAAAVTGFAATSHIPGFISLLNMTGPIAANWIVVTGDEYAAGVMYSRGIVVTCPVFTGQALDMLPRPFLPSQSELSIQMDVSFLVDELSYTTCCRTYIERERTIALNPIGNDLVETSTVRTNLVQTVTLEKMGLYFMKDNFMGEMFTMIAFDPDVPVSFSVGNESHPLLHQMQINIMGGDFSSGEAVIPWIGPAPFDDAPHYFYFLLYKHVLPVNRTQMLSYTGNCTGRQTGRCLFDINAVVRDNGFTLVGASWFRVVRDSYVKYRYIQSFPDSEATECAGEPGYTLNCEGDTSGGNTYNMFNVALTILALTMLIVIKFSFV